MVVIVRPRLAGLHFTSEAIFFCFSSTNSFTGGAEVVLVNRLAKYLPIYLTDSVRNWLNHLRKGTIKRLVDLKKAFCNHF